MDFRLIYEGPLQGQNSKAEHKWAIRCAFHPQLEQLWKQEPLATASASLLAWPPEPAKTSNIREKGGIRFVPLVTAQLKLFAELSVLLFRPSPRGELISECGDADNRLKTLIDALRLPHQKQKIPRDCAAHLPNPFYCLLEDDALVTKVSIETEQLLFPAQQPEHVLVILHVVIRKSVVTYENLGL